MKAKLTHFIAPPFPDEDSCTLYLQLNTEKNMYLGFSLKQIENLDMRSLRVKLLQNLLKVNSDNPVFALYGGEYINKAPNLFIYAGYIPGLKDLDNIPEYAEVVPVVHIPINNTITTLKKLYQLYNTDIWGAKYTASVSEVSVIKRKKQSC